MADELLSDSNVLVAVSASGHVDHQTAATALRRLSQQGTGVWITPQCLIEFWSVVIRPAHQNGLGMTTAQARLEVDRYLRVYPLLQDGSTVFSEWLDLVRVHGLVGKQVHDARLVAVMLAYGVPRILTFDETHFHRFTGITLIHPKDV